MQMKNVSVLWKIYTQLFKRIFCAFPVIFCASTWAREGYCAPFTRESLRPSLVLLVRHPPISKVDVIT